MKEGENWWKTEGITYPFNKISVLATNVTKTNAASPPIIFYSRYSKITLFRCFICHLIKGFYSSLLILLYIIL